MFAQEPDLKFVGAQHLANNQIIGAVIAQGGSPARERSGSTNDDLVSIEQARKLYGHFFATAGRPLNLRRLGYIRGHGDANAAEELNAFSDGVNQFILLVVMFVIKQMELIKGRTSNLPMRFLVQIAKGNGVGKKLVELLGHFQAHGLFQFERKRVANRSIGL